MERKMEKGGLDSAPGSWGELNGDITWAWDPEMQMKADGRLSSW